MHCKGSLLNKINVYHMFIIIYMYTCQQHSTAKMCKTLAVEDTSDLFLTPQNKEKHKVYCVHRTGDLKKSCKEICTTLAFGMLQNNTPCPMKSMHLSRIDRPSPTDTCKIEKSP